MRKSPVLAVLAIVLLAGSSQAASVPFVGTLSVFLATLPPIVASGSGTAVLNGTGGLGALSSLSIDAGEFSTTASIPVTDPAAFPIGGVKASFFNRAGSFSLGGIMGIAGEANICLFGACNASLANVNVPFTLNGTRGIGIGGAPTLVSSLVQVTVNDAPWFTGVVTAGTAMGGRVTRSGFIHGPASGGASTAAANSGVVALVTPSVINTNIGASSTLPAFGILHLRFVPEPGTLGLVASGVTGLGLLGRRRAARRERSA